MRYILVNNRARVLKTHARSSHQCVDLIKPQRLPRPLDADQCQLMTVVTGPGSVGIV